MDDHPWDVKNPQDQHVDVKEEVEHWQDDVEPEEVLNCNDDSINQIKDPGNGDPKGDPEHKDESDNEEEDVVEPSW